MKIFLIILTVLSIWLLTLFGVTYFFDTWETRAQFGDLFGSVNSLFSGFAFAALVYTVFLQRKELELQRKELKLQREEMAKSRLELAEQAKVQRLQFKSTISQLKANASLARIEAFILEGERKIDGAKEQATNNIKTEANKIVKLADLLEKEDK